MIVTKDPKSITMVEEIFGPVLTAFIYEDEDFEKTCELIDSTTDYALTGCMCVPPFSAWAGRMRADHRRRFRRFAQDRSAIVKANNLLRNASGMFYINEFVPSSLLSRATPDPTSFPQQVDRRRRRTAALWRSARQWNERQGWIGLVVLPLCPGEEYQGDVPSSDRVCVPFQRCVRESRWV